MLIKCHCCGTVIMDRSKSIYNKEYDIFFCNGTCEKTSMNTLKSKELRIKCDEDGNEIGQFYVDF